MAKKVSKDKTINELRAEAGKKGVPLLRSMKKQDILRALGKRKRSRKAPRGKTALPVQPTTVIMTKKPGMKRSAATITARIKKSEISTPKQSRVITPSLTLTRKKKTAIKKTTNKAALPIRKKQDPDRPLVKTAIKRSSGPLLPQEYGENDLFLIVVDPDVVYASWEIRRGELPTQRRGPMMRLFDVTVTGPDGRPDRFMDIAIPGRVGSGFFNIRMHGRDVVAEIGFLKDGRFQPILRSNMVSFPVPMHYYESPPEPLESGPPVGY
jgi:hypothetical protein